MNSKSVSPQELERQVEDAWAIREALSPATEGAIPNAIDQVIQLLDEGVVRVAEPTPSGWITHQWLKKAVLLSFRLSDNRVFTGGPGDSATGSSIWWDKITPKFAGWGENRMRAAGVRAVPGAIVRRSAFIGQGAVLMPSFVNVGAHIGAGTMIDTWATVGSCAQIGRNCHISGGAGIGGVLEPLQADPVIIEDGCFIGARSEVAEGVHVGQGAVLSMGVFLGASTRIIDRATGEVFRGHVPAWSVVVPGTMPGNPLPDGTPGPGLACAVIVKRVDEQTRSKTSINELLRD